MLLELFTGKLPYDDLTLSKYLNRAFYLPLLLSTIKHEGIFRLISECLNNVPTLRPSIDDLLNKIENLIKNDPNLSEPALLCGDDELVDLEKFVKKDIIEIISKEEWYIKKSKTSKNPT